MCVINAGGHAGSGDDYNAASPLGRAARLSATTHGTQLDALRAKLMPEDKMSNTRSPGLIQEPNPFEDH